jgi:RNA polymerase sigma factor (sigma-70 family)
MDDAELKDLVESVARDETGAFDRLARHFRPSIVFYVRRFLKRPEDVEDILQETLLAAYRAIRAGRYRHINQAAFVGWLRTIAHHAIPRLGSAEAPWIESLTGDDPAGEATVRDPAAPPEDLAQRLAYRALSGFLRSELDQVLIEREKTPAGKDLGLLKKLAFLHFYLDQYSQKETVTAVVAYGARLGLSAKVTQAAVNNWIARGDILKALVQHLVEQHHDMVAKLENLSDPDVGLAPHQAQLLEMHWRRRWTASEIARDRRLPAPWVEAELRGAKCKIAATLFQTVKGELHLLRFGKTN